MVRSGALRLGAALLAAALLASAGITIRPEQLAWAVVDRPYAPAPLVVQVDGDCPQTDVHVRVAEGALPEGVLLDPHGWFSGVPRKSGVSRFVIEASNRCAKLRKAYQIVVSGAPVLAAEPRAIELVWTQGSEFPTASVKIAATWPELAYAVEADPPAPWLKIAPRSGRTAREGASLEADSLALGAIPEKLAPGVYQTQLRISAWDAVNRPTVLVRLHVFARQ